MRSSFLKPAASFRRTRDPPPIMAFSYYKLKVVLTFCFCAWMSCSTSLFLYVVNSDQQLELEPPLRSVNKRFTVHQLSTHQVEKTIQWVLPVYKSAWSLDIVLKSYIYANITRNISIFKNVNHTKSMQLFESTLVKYNLIL